MNKVLVTGGSGFIGKEIIKHLSWIKFNTLNYDIAVNRDLLDKAQLEQHIRGVDMVIHIAAQANFMEMEKIDGAPRGVEVNVLGTNNVAYFCAKYGKPLIYGSTVCAYGNINSIGTEDTSKLNPSDLYAYSKIAGENIILGYSKTFNLQYLILRFATTYGPGMRKELGVYKFIDAAQKNNPLYVHGDGSQTRTQTHVFDIANGVVKAVQRFNKIRNNIINLTSTEKISAKQMAKDIIKKTKSKSKIKYMKQRKNQTYKESFSTYKAKKLLKWSPHYTWDKGIKNTIDWCTTLKGEHRQ
jgi:nucleoside-diphosphate-sugar epimerase